MKSASRILGPILLGFLASAALALAQPPGGGRRAAAAAASAAAENPSVPDAKGAPEKKDEEEKEPVLSVTDHEITLGGKLIKYKATAGYMAMKDPKTEKTKANIFLSRTPKVSCWRRQGGSGEAPDHLLVQRRSRRPPRSGSTWARSGRSAWR
jgi:hypothetical protein